MSPIDVVEHGTPYDDGIRFVSIELEKLAAESPTKKVTIVGHSNGGLVAKALMRRLEREGKFALVDSVIFVDVPQIGTPDTLVPMLHGDFGKLTNYGGLYLSKENARALAENMPDAYALLPSSQYFTQVSDPVIDLSSAPELRKQSGLTTPVVSIHADLERFLTSRAKPVAGDIETPNKLSSSLLAKAKELHQHLDLWTPPQGVRVMQVAGWGLDTPKGVRYTESKKRECTLLIFGCKEVTSLTHTVAMTRDGDGTVVTASQIASPGARYVIDIPAANHELKKNWRHADITESQPFQQLFAHLMSTSSTALPEFVTATVPNHTSDSLRLRVLSPVSLDAYDSEGRHTGVVQNPDPESDLLLKEEQIPNSYYQEYGEGKYLGLPVDGALTVKLKGLATGTFTYEVTEVSGEREKTTMYRDIPVTASSTAFMVIQDGSVSTAKLEIDSTGDDKTDSVLSADNAETPLSYIRLMRTNVPGMRLSTTTARQLVAKLTNIEYVLLKSNRWDEVDDDQDHNDIKKGEKVEKRVLRKVDRLELWVNAQLALRKLLKVVKVDSRKGDMLTPMQAEALLTMTSHLKTLLK